MIHITGTLVKSIMDSYHTNHSILKTAKATGASTVKVRKVLITERLWESDTSEAYMEEMSCHKKRYDQINTGIELVNDVGGIGGFCRMLRTIYETDVNDEEAMEERVGMLEWADMMGWTGRRISPKHTL